MIFMLATPALPAAAFIPRPLREDSASRDEIAVPVAREKGDGVR